MRYLINLFPQPKKNLSDQILYFALHYLRYILVITQFVAICVFFFRFKIDQEIIDLREKLTQKDSIVVATEDLVETIRETENSIRTVETITKDQTQFRDVYSYVLASFPESIQIESLEITLTGVSISASAETVDPIKGFFEKVRDEKKFGFVDMSNIEKAENRFKFQLRLDEFAP